MRFGELKRWSVNSFFQTQWQWPETDIAPLGKALERRIEIVDRATTVMDDLKLVTLRFDGSMEARKKQSDDFKGVLYSAHPDDVIYSRIDVRNGAIGVVPEDFSNVAVSNEFPVYAVRPEIASPAYIHLLVRTPQFLNLINTMISGASGRKRVQAAQLEEIPVPLPSLEIQNAIVKRAHDARRDYDAGLGALETKRAAQETNLFAAAGLAAPLPPQKRRVFALPLEEIERWDMTFFRRDYLELEHQLQKVPHDTLGRVAHFTSRPWKASDFPDSVFRYVEISAVHRQRGIVASREVKVAEAPSRATTLMRAGDLILSTTRPYLGGFALVPPEYDGAVCSSGFALCDQVDESRIDRDFLLAFLQSSIGLRQVERRMTGGLYPAIVQEELEKVPIPLPPLPIQQAIVLRLQNEQSEIEAQRHQLEADLEAARLEIEARLLGRRLES